MHMWYNKLGPTLQSLNKLVNPKLNFLVTSLLHLLKTQKAKKNKKNISCVQNSLVIESTTAAGGVAVFNDGFCEFSIQFISQSTGHTFPGQDNNNDNRIGTVVPRPLLHNA